MRYFFSIAHSVGLSLELGSRKIEPLGNESTLWASAQIQLWLQREGFFIFEHRLEIYLNNRTELFAQESPMNVQLPGRSILELYSVQIPHHYP